MAFLSIENINFSYEKNEVIKNFSLEVEEGSFTTLLGSSGSGKTTLLRLLMGFLEPSDGKILIEGKSINGVLPNKRGMGFVFQDYALFPHLTVEQNLLYGLKRNGKKEENRELVLKTASSLGIDSLLRRFPAELSGGQQQRVALGRALVLKPRVLLMDEPLSSLDTNLRQKVRGELKEIQQKLKITTVYVTHDQEEALSLSDKIAVMNNGRLVQYGSPYEIYFEPEDRFTASFIGRANFIENKMVRPEWIKLEKKENECELKGIVTGCEFLGDTTRYTVELADGKTITADRSTVFEEKINKGETVGVVLLKTVELEK